MPSPEKALRGQEDVVKTYVDRFIQRLAEHARAGSTMDIDAGATLLRST